MRHYMWNETFKIFQSTTDTGTKLLAVCLMIIVMLSWVALFEIWWFVVILRLYQYYGELETVNSSDAGAVMISKRDQ